MSTYVMFSKPYGVICQFSPSGNRLTLAKYVPISNIYPVGRLDADSEGLLLLTDDGALAHHLTDPRYQHPKTYWVQVEGEPEPEALASLRTGVVIRGHKTRPSQIRMLATEPDLPPRDPPIRFRRAIPTTWLEVIVSEGRNRQVRRMTATVGLPALRLVRMAIGPLQLGGLLPGQWRHLDSAEITALHRLQRRPSL